MPHVIIECSANVLESNLSSLLIDIHTLLTQMLPTQLPGCKSRTIRTDDYVIGNNDPQNAFVHVTVKVLKGRSKELLNSVANSIMEKLKVVFKESFSKLNLQFTIAIEELPEVYHKFSK